MEKTYNTNSGTIRSSEGMDYLSDVHSCCRALVSDKITERKKSAERLHQLLGKTTVIQTIDINSDEKPSKKSRRLLTWDDIFKAVIQYVQIETEHIKKGKSTSATSQQTKEKKKQEVSGLVKYVVKTADKRGPRLKWNSLVTSILEILADDYMCASYGLDFSNILMKNVLPVRKYWIELKPESWHDLLREYFKLFVDEECKLDRVLMARLIHLLLSGASRQCDLHPKKIFQFYTEVFKNIRSEKATKVLEHILSSLNIFVLSVASNSRLQVCKLGENIFINLLYLWNNRPSPIMKDEIVSFLSIQLQSHHPGGSKSTANGAFALDWDQWMSHLRKLYEVLYTDLKEMGGRHRFSSSKDFALKQDYVELAADVCHQLFDDTATTIDVTQLPSTSTNGTPAKKRRLLSGWSTLRDIIIQFSNVMQVIPWLQLLSRVIEKYPNDIPQDELKPILDSLVHILEDCKRSEILKQVLICLKKIIEGYPVLHVIYPDLLKDCQVYWQKIWSATLRTVSSHRAELEGLHAPGFQLLTELIQQHLIVPEKYVWNLFLPSISTPTESSIYFISRYISSFELAENYKPSILGSGDISNGTSHPLRTHLLHWLLPSTDTNISDKQRIVCNPDKLACVLVGLTLRNPEAIRCKHTKEQLMQWTHLENVYLTSSLDCELEFEKSVECKDIKEQVKTCNITDLYDLLQRLLHNECRYYNDIAEDQLSTLENMALLCSLLSKTVYYLLEYDVLTEVTCQSCNIITDLKQLLSKFSTWLCDYKSRDGVNRLTTVLSNLHHMFTLPSLSHSAFIIQELNRKLTPSRLLDTLIEIAMDKLPRSNSKTDNIFGRPDRQSSSSSRRPVIDDLDDLGFGDTPSLQNQSEDLMEIDSEIPDSQDSDEVKDQTKVCVSLLNSDSLTEHQSIRLQVINLLCLWCSHNKKNASLPISIQASVETSFIRNKLTELLDESNFDCDKAIDLQILRCLVYVLTSDSHKVTEKDLENLTDGLRQVARFQRRDEDIILLCLKLLKILISYCIDYDDMPSTVQLECRDILLHLLSAYWKLKQEGQYTYSVRLMVAICMETFVKADPNREWSKIKTRGNNNNNTTEETSVIEELPKCLNDTSHEVRLFASSAIKRLFFNDNNQQIDDKMFVLIYQMCNDLLDLPDKISADRKLDEVRNRTSTLLLTLSTTAIYSQLVEKKAVFAFCQMIREKGIEIHLVRKILCKIASKLGYKNVSSFLTSHLPYLINQWLQLCYPIAEFPYQLLQLTDIKEFYRRYQTILIPELFMKKDMGSIEKLCGDIEENMNDIIISCIPRITIYILPLFAASSSKELQSDVNVRKRIALATASYEKLCQLITKDTLSKRISENIDVIVVNVLMCLHNDTDSKRPEPNPPYYNQYIIISTLDYLTNSFSCSKSLISVLIKSQDAIQKILLDLSVSISNEHRLHEKHRILEIYQLFVKLLLKVFHEKLGGSWAFVLRDVIYRLVYIIIDLRTQRNGNNIQHVDTTLEICLSLLFDVCQVSVEHCPQELCKYLRLIISNIIICMDYGGNIQDRVKDVLKLLVIQNTKVMKSGILRLDSFPDNNVNFKSLLQIQKKLKYGRDSFTFDQEIEYFLEVCEESESRRCSYVELLKHLYQQLLKNDCTGLIKQLHLTTDKRSNIFLRLIRQLLTLLQYGSKEEKIESARCLGVIGPVDLSVLSLSKHTNQPSLRTALQVYNGDTDCEKYCYIFHQLDQYLCDPSINIVQCTSDVLKNILATKTGISFSTEYKAKLADKDHLFHYLHPFKPKNKTPTTSPAPISRDVFSNTIDKEELWTPVMVDHDSWITKLTCNLLQSQAVHDDILYLLHPIALLKPELCELILPYIIYDILVHGNKTHKDIFSTRIDSFFKSHSDKDGSPHSISRNKKSVKTMLSVIQYLRQQDRPRQEHQVKTPWDNNFWLSVNYFNLSVAAHYCSSHFMSLLYSEIWCDILKEEMPGRNSQSQGNSQDFVSNIDDNILQELMLETYRCIGDPDGIYGCGAGQLAESTSRIKTYMHENRWDKAVVTYDIETDLHSQQFGFYQSVQEFGASHLLNSCLQGNVAKGAILTPQIEELQYEAAWKTGQWNLEAPMRFEKGVGFHQGIYSCLEAVKNDQTMLIEKATTSVREEIVNAVQLYGNCCQNVYPVLSQLNCLHQLDQFNQILSSNGDLSNLFYQWNNEILAPDFHYIEPILILQSAIIKTLNNDDLQDNLFHSLLHLSKQARQASRFQISERAIYDLHKLDNNLSFILLTQMEEAKLYWARSEINIAKNLIKTLLSRLERLQDVNETAVTLLPQALGTYGNWLAETRSENPTVIMENYLERTVQILHENDDKTTCLEAYLSLARFADTQYQNIVNYMKSSTYESKQALLKKAKQDVEDYKMVSSDKDRYLRILEKQSELDEKELRSMKEDRSKFLIKALEFYIKCLQCGDKYDLRIFRVISLWFDDSNSTDVNGLLADNIESIKSYKFLPLMYQLAARMGSESKGLSLFHKVLNQILERTAIDHPHHALSIILALANANKDMDYIQQAKSSKRSSNGKSSDTGTKEEDRVQAAKNMITRLKLVDKIKNIILDLEKLSDAYIELANTNVEQHRKESRAINLPDNLSITKMKNLTNVAFPTIDTKVNGSCDYDDIVYVQGFEKNYKLAGGINLPKIITCTGSDGIGRRQLVKGKDDLRQDAVMQQVFGMVNNLLRKDSETRKRNLHIRQYKVIPLSQRSGLLEWCEGTQPLGDYLIGNSSNKGAHQRYRPQDLVPIDARRKLAAVHDSADVRKKYKTYKDVCAKFKPVFRHFFMEKFFQPALWFERRLAYTRSVATNSIVGYILGLGDRHVQNILVDCNTAELVHIDLGIAFEQGKILPTPETVSFRLTRDIVDGMGPTGVEGVFRRCCEKTMEVMHTNQESLMTIVQVLLYDPLYVWTLSPQKAHALQLRQNRDVEDLDVTNNDMNDITNTDDRSAASQEQVNKLAERVLLRLQQKLQGIEDSVQLSISGQVNLLIEEARDPKKLCRLFPGWQPHL
ncbi:hypothetical protein LOTGIDRAFT_229208 [Lottia gigantea]|uniref:non-specific serine/threonine protein kinase n=1 Tax=Lottia gigantea TaxID=225164 RepID=V3ZYA6_LOTGI|nr:hypothetical protein LOTGIDRAFT_229208 [Lottia gigantea]ESO89357.1 hypothetical protein LOTGIDRAFT_229208 [Lottia gigantea]